MCEGAYNPANLVQIAMPSASKFTVRNLPVATGDHDARE